MEERIALVTGGGQGIGRATALAFARTNAHVVVADVDCEAGAETAGLITAAGGKSLFFPTDVANETDIMALCQEVKYRFSRLDVLINNAAIGSNRHISERSTEEWDRVIAVNLRGPYLLTRHALPLLRLAGGGAIINIASTRAFMSEADTEPYSASKGGLVALTHSLAISLAGERIRVNCISPGWIDVTSWQKGSPAGVPLSQADHTQHPVGRVGTPQDIAEACLFLASDKAGFITGSNLVVDGGMTVKMIYV